MSTNGDDVPNEAALGRLYERWTLDVLPGLAPAAGALFARSPQRFKQVDRDVATDLARFYYRTDHDDGHLGSEQRRALLLPLLGESDGVAHEDGESEFHRAARAVRSAAVDFVQRSEDTGEAQLRAAFRDTLTTFQLYLTSLLGAVVDHAVDRTEGYFDTMVDVLQDPGFAGGFGLSPAPSNTDWPFGLDLNGNGAVLVEELAGQASTLENAPAHNADQHTFILVQRIGHFGRLTIEGALGAADRSDEETDGQIDQAYRWWTALRNLRGE